MKRGWITKGRLQAVVSLVAALFLAALVLRCTPVGHYGAGTNQHLSSGRLPIGKRTAPKTVPGLPLVDGYTVGMPKILANLAVFPIYASVQEDIGDFTTLEAALERGTAVVRELGGDDDEPSSGQQLQQQSYRGDGAQVNTLVIENKGDLPILVLAGTVVKGGKQDRQIGQDFLIGARETTPVDAFCVEHGRWNANRDGSATEGKFTTTKALANAQVRAAGQYKQNQSEVWSKVGEVNKAHKKQTASDTLVASVEASDVVAQREAIGREINAFLLSAESAEDIVGLAYAVDGKVRGVRWFMNRKIFLQHQDTLVSTAALEAVTAQAVAKENGQEIASGATEPEAIAQFVNNIEAARKEERSTAAENVNSYQFADDGYAAETMVKTAPAAANPATPDKAPPKPKAVTKDYLSK